MAPKRCDIVGFACASSTDSSGTVLDVVIFIGPDIVGRVLWADVVAESNGWCDSTAGETSKHNLKNLNIFCYNFLSEITKFTIDSGFNGRPSNRLHFYRWWLSMWRWRFIAIQIKILHDKKHNEFQNDSNQWQSGTQNIYVIAEILWMVKVAHWTIRRPVLTRWIWRRKKHRYSFHSSNEFLNDKTREQKAHPQCICTPEIRECTQLCRQTSIPLPVRSMNLGVKHFEWLSKFYPPFEIPCRRRRMQPALEKSTTFSGNFHIRMHLLARSMNCQLSWNSYRDRYRTSNHQISVHHLCPRRKCIPHDRAKSRFVCFDSGTPE